MRVDYIAFSKTWIAKLKETTREDPILGTVYQLTQQGWPHQRRHTPRKKVQKQRIKPASPTYRLGLKELQQQLQPQDPSPHCASRQVVPSPRSSVCRRLVERSLTPQLVTAGDKPMQVPEITSEFMRLT